MKTANLSFLTILAISLTAHSIPIHTRFPPNGGVISTNPISLGDSCNVNGREAYLVSSVVKYPVSFVVCRQTVGYKSEVSRYTLPGKSAPNDDNTRQYLGCTVSKNGVATGYDILWFSFGDYTPSDIKDASKALVIEATYAKKDTSVLENYHTKRDILIDYIRGDGVLISNILVPKASINNPPTAFPRSRTIVRAKYSFPYSGDDVPCNY
ncbi:hypothetical protein LVQ79_10535 [Buttiauxella sp. A2-C1_F]|uniref:hypothetical protein n=1 Tax=Buttiauxella sp. A2-C1_F TaxID=2904526 RepID=UPI001E637EE5|nr:hypothetical protein [Buttiauxella sp. A2-C1_F]MCE0845981.1 hypothetical protein [Buttiauxella sp. A2-C1_F]